MRLTKTIFQTKETEKIIDRNFSEVKIEHKKISTADFFKQYKRLFFDIPKTGIDSHQSLIEESTSYISDNDDFVNSKDQQIEELNQKISSLELALADLKVSTTVKDVIKNVKDFNKFNPNK